MPTLRNRGSLSLRVTTTAHGTVLPAPNLRQLPPRSPAPVVVWRLLLALIPLLFVPLRKFRRRGTIGFAPLGVLVLGVALVSGGCGITADNTPAVVVPGTSAGVYPLVVTATGSGNVTATTTVSLTVN